MLRNTFCHIPGIGPKAEERLWSEGIRSWQDACAGTALPLSPARCDLVRRHAEESLARLAAKDAGYFADGLPSTLHWRLFPEFRDSTAYLDIETTGLGGAWDHVTTIALYDGRAVRTYVHGQNLEAFPDDVRDCRLLVTYNGKTFDIPFLERQFGIRLPQAHVDLRYVLHRLGYRGGLKGCERRLGLDRGELTGVDGFFAVLLWQEYRRSGDPRALETLLAYNVQDTVGLETLLVMAYNMHVGRTSFAETHSLPLPAVPPAQFVPHRPTIRRIQRQCGWA
ncbi:MAG: ribonuclease H-like domain-containing protein [Candidatus Brocadiaceae bacterium]|nr:ribonuclease H-like domain-containing protein [Candidatus Brocadiaceae bacterium]